MTTTAFVRSSGTSVNGLPHITPAESPLSPASISWARPNALADRAGPSDQLIAAHERRDLDSRGHGSNVASHDFQQQSGRARPVSTKSTCGYV